MEGDVQRDNGARIPKFLLARFCMKEVLDPLHQILGVPMEMNLRDRG